MGKVFGLVQNIETRPESIFSPVHAIMAPPVASFSRPKLLIYRVTIHRRNTTPPWVMVVVIVLGLFFLWRAKLALLMLAAIVGGFEHLVIIIVGIAVAFMSLGERRRRRSF